MTLRVCIRIELRVQQESLISTPEYKVIDPKYTIPKLPRVNKTQPFRWPDHPFYSGNCHLTGCCNWLNSNMYRSQSAVCNFGIFRFSAPGKMQEKVDGPLTVQYPCPCYILRMYALENYVCRTAQPHGVCVFFCR